MKTFGIFSYNDIDDAVGILADLENSYCNDESKVSDAEYDDFREHIVPQLPINHPYLDKVGHPSVSNFEKVKHSQFMGSQFKAKNDDEFDSWVSSVTKELGKVSPCYTIEHKIDGFSMSIIYEGGKLKQVVTRGDGLIGEDITVNAKMFRGLPAFIELKNSVVKVRAEGVIKLDDYAELVKTESYKNPRNAASGISRRHDGKSCTYISVIAYEIEGAGHQNRVDKFKLLSDMGFSTPSIYFAKNPEEVKKIRSEYTEGKRDGLNYEIDGLVVKLSDEECDILGIKDNRPVGQIAFKFGAEEVTSVVKEISFQVGRTGVITPVAKIEPVDLLGSTITSVGLSNVGLMDQLGVGAGSIVTVSKRGDIIPKIEEVVANPIHNIPWLCPCCNSSLDYNDVNLWCSNKQCKDRVTASILFWFTQIGIERFSTSFVERLYEDYGITSVSQIYQLKRDQFDMTKKMDKLFFDELERTANMTPERFVAALGVDGLGDTKSGILIKKYGFKGIWDLKADTLASEYGFGCVSATTIVKSLSEVKEDAFKILPYLNLIERSGKLLNMSFCVTGSLEIMERGQFQEKVISNGGIYKSGISHGLDFLVTNTPDSGSTKNQKAAKYGTKLITETQFLDMLK